MDYREETAKNGKKKRQLTAEELAIAAKLKVLVENKIANANSNESNNDIIAGRKKKRLTQQDIAAEIDMQQSTLNQYLNGVIPINLDILLKICYLANLSIAEIKRIAPNLTQYIPEDAQACRMYNKFSSLPQVHKDSIENIIDGIRNGIRSGISS